MADTKVKKNKKEKVEAPQEVSKYASLLKSPRVTEKANLLMQNNVYVFEVVSSATKREIMKAVKDMHKVTPVRVNIVRHPEQIRMIRGKRTEKPGVKKAYVYLKKGDKIE